MPQIQADWYYDHANLVILTSWMADQGYDATEVAYAVEKPWKYATEFSAAMVALDPEGLG